MRRLQGFHPPLMGVRFECRRPTGADFAQQLLHSRAQARPMPAVGEAQQPGIEGFAKIMDIAKVRWHRFSGRKLRQHAGHRRVAAGSRLAEHEHMVAGLAHRQGETQRLLCAPCPNLPTSSASSELRSKSRDSGSHNLAQFAHGQSFWCGHSSPSPRALINDAARLQPFAWQAERERRHLRRRP